MTRRNNQGFWAPGGATIRFPPRMRLARSERERLWKGLERFVNCEDSESDYQALGRAFPEFWPVDIWHYPYDESHVLGMPPVRLGPSEAVVPLSDEEMALAIRTNSLNWHKTCHRLFLFYRDTLRGTWSGKKETAWLGGGREEFLMGLSNLNDEAREKAEEDSRAFLIFSGIPSGLYEAWQGILSQFPTAVPEGRRQISMLWAYGEFLLVPGNDFQRAFYLLFRQSWRARVCSRCKMFFVARRPKQTFCGTVCSAGSRLASKRKWWRSEGTKRRAGHRETSRKRNRRERKRR